MLIEFLFLDMKIVGFIMWMFIDLDLGEEIVVVYVFIIFNFMLGYLELVFMDELVLMDWDFDDVMSFIMLGGVVVFEYIYYFKSVVFKDFI